MTEKSVISEDKLDKLDDIISGTDVSGENITIESWEDIDELIQGVDFRIEKMSEDCIWVCLYQPNGKDIHLNFFSTESGLELAIHDQ